MKAVIIGAGAAGLAIGWRLAQSKCTVEIIERGLAGRGSTWAAAGMLAAVAETRDEDGPVAQLARRARSRWAAFARELADVSGTDVGYRECGSLLVAMEEPRADALRALSAALRGRGVNAAWLDGAEARRREPLLSQSLQGAMYAPDDGQVDNRALGEALVTAFMRAGGRLRELCEVRGVHRTASSVCGVDTSHGQIEADCVVLASGAWMNRIPGLNEGELPPVRPAKGQMTALAPHGSALLPHHLIWGPDVYLVPRSDTLLVGATVEDSGFETAVDRITRERLLRNAAAVAPELRYWSVRESWAGLRPLTPDHAPVLGETAIPHLFVAGGQFRNGILFTPAVADLLSQQVLGKPVESWAKDFDPRRFPTAA